MTTFQTSQLDFENIKENLKTYLKAKDEFTDYDFEASGLSNILDVLAYNTHLNALIANFGLNETYLASAQLRSSVTSIANMLGYNIRSNTASTAYLSLSVDLSGIGSPPTSVTLPAGTKFVTSVDNISYTFQTISSYIGINDGTGIYTFYTDLGSESIPVYEGQSKTKTFIVNSNDPHQIYVIPDTNMDSSIVTVKVYDTYASTDYVSYTDINEVIKITPTSTFYKIYESPNGYFEISFGDGVTTGLHPTIGNKIEVEYISTSGADANRASSFSPVSQLSVNGGNYDIDVAVISRSAGGSGKESTDSIRQNAPIVFAAQQRLVTAQDYKGMILSTFSSVRDAIAWGGEDHSTPTYGLVYVSLIFHDNIPAEMQALVKSYISDNLNENLAILTIGVDFIDPVATYLQIEVDFSFDPGLTSLTKSSIENIVNAEVAAYVNDNLKDFTGSFRKSNLATEIDELSPAILSSEIAVKIQQRLTPVTEANEINDSRSATYNLYYPVPLLNPSTTEHVINSTSFYYDGQISKVVNKLGSTVLQITDLSGNVLLNNVGIYYPDTGHIALDGFAPGVITSGDSYIKFSALPRNDNVIKPLRNFYLDIDASLSYSAAQIDRNETSIAL